MTVTHSAHLSAECISSNRAGMLCCNLAPDEFRAMFHLISLALCFAGAVRCALPVAGGGVVNLLVLSGYHGVDRDSEKLGLSNQLVLAASGGVLRHVSGALHDPLSCFFAGNLQASVGGRRVPGGTSVCVFMRWARLRVGS